MCRFYGWSWTEVLEMDAEEFEQAWKGITQVEALETLVAIKVAQFPTMNRKDQTKFHRSLHKMAYPKTHNKKRAITPQELMAKYGG